MRLREGTPLEIFTDREGEIILKKYSPMMELTSFAVQYAEAMAQSTGLFVCITDRDQVIAVAGGAKKDLLQKNISRQLEQAINERSTVIAAREDKAFIQLVDEELEGISAQVVAPIICEGDAIGAVSLMSREPRAKFGDAEMKLASTLPGFWDGRWKVNRYIWNFQWYPGMGKRYRGPVPGCFCFPSVFCCVSHSAK